DSTPVNGYSPMNQKNNLVLTLGGEMTFIGILLASQIGCGGKSSDTAGGDINGNNACDIEIDETYPSSGGEMYYRGSVTAELSDDDESASISVADSSGAAVSGSSSVDGDTITFTPDSPLTSGDTYTATVDYCAGPASFDFTVSSLGTPLSVDISGNTYAVDLASGNFVEPAGIGDLIGGLLENDILIGVKSADNDVLSIRGAISETGNSNQDYCSETLESFPDADFSESPYFEIPEGDVTLSVAGIDLTINSLSISGTFAEDGSYFGGGEVSGQLDARVLAPLAADLGLEDDSPEALCNLLLGFGVQCIPCGDGEPYCANLRVNRLSADETGETLGLVCEGDCHESCSANASECTEPQALDLGECPQ
ncbi:MAG: Ig-like domain-containing protein, partial [Myxococcota bacterium]|nr:Ig-like domain-containing protein [Myxococcota bacterium]